MNQQKIEPDYQQMSSVLAEVIGGAKQDSLEPIVNIFMESVESQGYWLHEIIQAIEGYTVSRYGESAQYKELGHTLEKAVKEAEKLHESTKNA